MVEFKRIIKKKYPTIQIFYRKLKFFLRTLFLREFLPQIHEVGVNISRFGSEHGWEFIHREYLYNSTVISVGLGEDASFDTEFCSKYGATIFLLDPTPSSVAHYVEIRKNFGRSRTCDYISGGKQPAGSYELAKVSGSNFHLIPKALWDKTGDVEFFAPANSHHNSFSITNLQNTSESIVVPAITYQDLLILINRKGHDVKLLKLDVEGAATEVLSNILNNGFRPKQILVEFEEIFTFSIGNVRKLKLISKSLREANYELISTDYVANFVYEFTEEESY